MADRYWVLGSGTWNASSTANWSTSSGSSGASAPTSSDTVIFDNNSNVGTGAFTVTVSAAVCLDMTFGSGASALDGAMTLAMGTSTLGVSGNWTNPSSNFSYSGTGTISFLATSSKTITTNGISFVSNLTFNGVAGTWQLQDNLTTGTARTTTLTNGTIDLNNKTLSTGLFVSNNSNTRSISFGTSGKITITGNNATVWNTATGTGFTYSGTSNVNFNYSGSTGTRTVAQSQAGLGGGTATALDMTFSAGSDTIDFGGAARVYGNTDFTGFTGTYTNALVSFIKNLTFSTGMTVGSGANTVSFIATTGTQAITTNGKTLDFPLAINGAGGTMAFQDALTQGSTRAFTILDGTVQLKAGATSTMGAFATSGTSIKYLQSTLAGTQATISQASGTVNANYLTIKDSNATGGATFNAFTGSGNSSSANNVNSGNNTGWNFIPSGSGFLSFF